MVNAFFYSGGCFSVGLLLACVVSFSSFFTKNKNDEKYFWKSRKKKDIFGNNSLHFAFNIKDSDLKFKFINILLDE
jgi:hypothetical protein